MRRAARLLAYALVAAAAAAAIAFALAGENGGHPPRPDGENANPLRGVPLSSCLDLESADAGEPKEGDARAIAREIERIRRLSFKRRPRIELVSDEELDERIHRLSERDIRPRQVADEERLLRLLGALPPNADLRESVQDALEGEVVGFYDTRTRELVATASGDLDPIERATIAHELEHALADQALGIPVDERPDRRRPDSLYARQALVEGDATLTMMQFMVRTLSFADLSELAADPELLRGGGEGFDRLPHFLRRQLLSPYLDGLGFVCALYAKGGWRAVDRAYEDPPATGYEILFPQRYRSPRSDPPDPGRLGGRWQRRMRTELGAAPLLWLFQAPGGDRSRALAGPRALVSAWGGGEAELWVDGERSALGVSLVDRDRGLTLCAAISGWYANGFQDARRVAPARGEQLAFDGPDQDAAIRCRGGVVRLGIAPTLGAARRLTR